MARGTRLLVLTTLTLAVLVAPVALPRIPQSSAYHDFADHRAFLGLPNFLDVVSNAPLFLVAALGLLYLWRQWRQKTPAGFRRRGEVLPYAVFFAALALTAAGSAYYHLAPDNQRLVWDRLPLSLLFMSFLAAVIAERISVKAALLLLLPLLAAGINSVLYWHYTELAGAGDLRLYLIVQGYPLLAVPLIFLLFAGRYTHGADLLGVVGLYALAKAFELIDSQVFSLGSLVSGHTLKHGAAAAAAYWLLRMLRRRQPLPDPRFP